MKTRVKLEPDVLALIRAAMHKRGVSLNEALNAAVRAGLTQPEQKGPAFVQQTFSLDQNRTSAGTKRWRRRKPSRKKSYSRQVTARTEYFGVSTPLT